MSREEIQIGKPLKEVASKKLSAAYGETVVSAMAKINKNFEEVYEKTDDIETDSERFIIDAGGAAIVEDGLSEIVVTGGRPTTFPNVIGSASAEIQGEDFSPGSTWGADSGYVAGSADVASIHGGYDSINNQSGSTIIHSDHSHLQYNSAGHSAIVGGAYVLISAGRAYAGGCQNTALEGSATVFPVAIGCSGTIVDANYGVALGGDNVEVHAEHSLATGKNLEIQTGHGYSRIAGRDADSFAYGSDTFGGLQINERNDCRSGIVVLREKTTDATLQTMGENITLPAGKVFSALIKVSLLAMADGSADANNDSNYEIAGWTGEFLFSWDGTNGYFADTGGTTGPSTNPLKSLTLVRDDITVGTTPTVVCNGGLLRVKVTGAASHTINWVAKMDIQASTLVS